MSGLEKLRSWSEQLKKSGYFGDYEVAENIADEIERDMNNAVMVSLAANSMREFADRIEKPFSDDDTMKSWLDRWYLPRPVIDGEPVQFGDEFGVVCDGKLRPLPVSALYFFEDGKTRLFLETSKNCGYTPLSDQVKRFNRDSIEKLWSDINNALLCGYQDGVDCDIDE